MKKLAAAFLVIALYAAPSIACDLCAIYRGTEARENRPGFYAGLYEQFTHFGTLQEDGEEIPNPAGQYLDSSITQLIAGYQFDERFGVQVNVPYIHRAYKRAEGFAIDRGRENGIGDMTLTGSARVYENLTENTFFIWSVLAGVKFPTGDADRLKEELAEEEPPPGAPESGIHGHDLALGSGSYDAVVGTSAAFHWDRFFTSASVQYAIRTRGELDYRYANDLLWSVIPGLFLIVEHDHTLGAALSVSGETKGKDNFRGEKAADTGITSVFLGPELSFTWKENVSAVLGADFRISADNTALQIVPDYRIRAGLIWRI